MSNLGNFIINPLEKISTTYQYRFDTLAEAMNEAEKLCQQYGISIEVFQLHVTCNSVISWDFVEKEP